MIRVFSIDSNSSGELAAGDLHDSARQHISSPTEARFKCAGHAIAGSSAVPAPGMRHGRKKDRNWQAGARMRRAGRLWGSAASETQ